MILTNCAACAAPLAHDAPRCVRCKVRYCDSTCQHDHWRRGHKQMCKKIHRGGNAEQYNADKKYKEAVAEAVEACADDTKGQTCYICTQALHWKTKEPRARAKILNDEALENNWDDERWESRWKRWYSCSMCEQNYHGVVVCALGWACWKTYLGRPETDPIRSWAMNCLGNGLQEAGHYEDAVTVQEADVSMKRRIGAPEYDIISAQSNLANTYQKLGRHEQALIMRPDLYSRTSKLFGEESKEALMEAINYSGALLSVKRYKEAKALLRKMIPVAERIFGNDENTLTMRWNYAITLYQDSTATRDDLHEAVTTLEDADRIARRVFGGAHPIAVGIERSLRNARAVLRAREAGKDVVWVKP